MGTGKRLISPTLTERIAITRIRALETDRGRLLGDLGDLDRPTELTGRFAAGEDAGEVGSGPFDDQPGLLDPRLQGAEQARS